MRFCREESSQETPHLLFLKNCVLSLVIPTSVLEHLLYCYTLFGVVENGVELHGVDGEDAGVGARGVGGRALSRRGAAHARLPHARARHHLPDDRPEPAGEPLFCFLR